MQPRRWMAPEEGNDDAGSIVEKKERLKALRWCARQWSQRYTGGAQREDSSRAQRNAGKYAATPEEKAHTSSSRPPLPSRSASFTATFTPRRPTQRPHPPPVVPVITTV